MKQLDLNTQSTRQLLELLLGIILRNAVESGLTDKEAQDIYVKITHAINKNCKTDDKFASLVNEILNGWSIPLINHFGVFIQPKVVLGKN
ncbi:MAG: hypothetical protein Q8M15_02020 [Bacteroidota bacterium]|nr:hypothetical protein [Bacteroidota bacterium]